MSSFTKIQSHLYSGAQLFLILACFFTPFSSSMMGTSSLIALACYLLSGRLGMAAMGSKNIVPILCAALLFAVLTIGVVYSPAILSDALATLKKYRELLFLVMAFMLTRKSRKTGRYGLHGFIAGSLLLLVLSYAMYFHLIPTEKYGYSTIYHITHSFFMAFLAFWALQFLFVPSPFRIFWLIVLPAVLFNLFYIAPGRTGMMVFLLLIGLTLLQRLTFRYSLATLLLVCLCTGGAYKTSHNFSTRINEAIDEIQNYNATSSRTSLGQRFDWWQNSVELIREKPLIGHGTGSFAIEQQRIIGNTKTKHTDNPHNEFLFIAVQTGAIGLSLFVGLLLSLFLSARSLDSPAKQLLQGVVVAMAFGCLMNSFLYDSHQGHFFAFLSGILLADPWQLPDEETG